MNIKKFNNGLKIFIIIISTVLVIAIPVSIIFMNSGTKKLVKKHECTQMGKFCSQKEINDGVEVEIAITPKKTERFYVISNTETTMTLIMAKNIIKEIDWHDTLSNLYGPDIPLIELSKKTKSWSTIKKIKSYSYQDGGLLQYEAKCKAGISKTEYDCKKDLIATRGYLGLKIENGVLTQKANIYENPMEGIMATNVNARMITAEEIDNLVYKKKLPNWLIDNLGKNEGYWTMTSSTSKKTNYSQGAIALANINKEPSIESLFVQKVYEPKYEIGVRPVITVEKEYIKPKSGH